MTVYRTYNTYSLLTTVLILVLSALACSIAVPTTPTTVTAMPTQTVVNSSTTPDNTPEWSTTVVRPVVNVRKTPGGEVIDTLTAGDTVEIIECSKNWCQIKEPAGYIFRGCLSDNPAGLGCQAK